MKQHEFDTMRKWQKIGKQVDDALRLADLKCGYCNKFPNLHLSDCGGCPLAKGICRSGTTGRVPSLDESLYADILFLLREAGSKIKLMLVSLEDVIHGD